MEDVPWKKTKTSCWWPPCIWNFGTFPSSNRDNPCLTSFGSFWEKNSTNGKVNISGNTSKLNSCFCRQLFYFAFLPAGEPIFKGPLGFGNPSQHDITSGMIQNDLNKGPRKDEKKPWFCPKSDFSIRGTFFDKAATVSLRSLVRIGQKSGGRTAKVAKGSKMKYSVSGSKL